MEPNWMYWEESDFNINRVVVDLVEETQTRVLALQDGEADRAYIPSAQKTEFCNNMEDLPNANGKDGFRCTYRQTYSVVNVPVQQAKGRHGRWRSRLHQESRL